MKRRDLLRHLEEHGCEFLREGANHTVYINRKIRKASTIPDTARSTKTSLTRSAEISRFRDQTPNVLRLTRGGHARSFVSGNSSNWPPTGAAAC